MPALETYRLPADADSRLMNALTVIQRNFAALSFLPGSGDMLRANNLSDVLSTSTALANIGGTPATRSINTLTPLIGGGNLTGDLTLALANTAVTPGAYTSANITVDAQGRITAAANGSGGGSGAPTNAEYALGMANGSLPNGRLFTDTATVTWDVTTANQVKASSIMDASSVITNQVFGG